MKRHHLKKTPARQTTDGHTEASGLAGLAQLAAVAQGISESELRRALEAEAARYQAVAERTACGVCLFDAGERLVRVNRRFIEIYGAAMAELPAEITLEEIVERYVAAHVPTVDGTVHISLARTTMADATPRTLTIELGDGRKIRINYGPVADGGLIVTHEDITELEAHRALAEERLTLQTLIDWVPFHLWVKDTGSRFIIANKALAADCLRTHTRDMIGLTDFDLHAPDAARNYRDREKEILATGRPMVEYEEAMCDASGRRKWFASTKVPLRNDDGEICGLVGIAQDITWRKKEDNLRDGQSGILEMIATGAPLGEVLTELMHLVEAQLTGIFGSVLLLDEDGIHLRHGAAPSLAPDYAKAVDGASIGPRAGSCGTAAYRRQPVIVTDITTDPLWDDYRALATPHGYRSCWSTPILTHKGDVLGVFAMYSRSVREPADVETNLIEMATRIAGIAIERKQAEDRIHFMANHDALTGLPNRTLLDDRLAQAVLYAQRNDHWVTVVFLDLDNFKIVNDSLGHSAGDRLLRTVARRMSECVRATDTVVRLGGDEFVILLSDQPKSVETVSETLQKIRSAITEPIDLEGHRLKVTCSIGVANYPEDGTSADALLANADAAMYRAKELGRDNFVFYAPEFNIEAHEKLVMQKELRDALARSELTLFYQPQVDLVSNRIFATEALIRWRHPARGWISPDRFIPTAEETGLIVQIGDWVLHEACRQNRAWQDAGLPPMAVCVNVSARQFKERTLTERVVCALHQSGLEPRYLELELTESLIMQDVDLAIATMKELKALGVQLSIDDFGTGYSSLSALTTFPVTRLKIDKSFIRELATDANGRAVTGAIISLGQELNLRITAEGVETDEQVAILRDNSCHEMQGYRFSRPVPPDGIETMLRSEHPWATN